MKLISNRRIIQQTAPSGTDKGGALNGEAVSEVPGGVAPAPVTTLPVGAVEGGGEETKRDRRGRASDIDTVGGFGASGVSGRIGIPNSVNILPSDESAPSSTDAVEPPPPPPPPPNSSHGEAIEPRNVLEATERSEDRHRVTWVMLRLLAANGKVKAADGSDLLVSYLGEEPPLGDVFQIEATSPDMEQRTMTVVVLANQESVEVLGAQEIIVVDSAPFQIERQPITTSQELAEAIYKYIEIELRPMGDILVNAAREALSSGS